MGSRATTLAELVAFCAQSNPDGQALIGTSSTCTWREYDNATRRLASLLRDRGITAGDRVAVALPKDAASFIAVHAVLRAGAVVVPIDPLAPALVARSAMDDAGISALFAHERLIDAVNPFARPGTELRLVVGPGEPLDRRIVPWSDALSFSGDEALPEPTADEPAYIIYTSGSTGRPKGIVHTHRSAMAYAERAVESHGITDRDRLAGMSPLHFDMSTLELYAAPLAGAAVVVFGEAHLRFPASFTQRSEEHGVSVWYTVPSFLRHVVERGAIDRRDLSTLRLVMYGGEPYTADGIHALFDALPGIEVKNIYGPAEVNECTNHRVEPEALDHDPPIGRPWSGVDVLVVDDDDAPVPVGVQGELWVSAPTLMAGYWNRPDLDARCLVPRVDGPDWYRTGDLVTLDDDGCYRFVGRRDHQVKVRGIRIELEAVEAALDDAPGVLHGVAVAVGPPGDVSHLVGVVVPRDPATFDPVAVVAHCRARLPAIAVPREIITRSELPSTPTGKIDRRTVRSQFSGAVPVGVDGGGMA